MSASRGTNNADMTEGTDREALLEAVAESLSIAEQDPQEGQAPWAWATRGTGHKAHMRNLARAALAVAETAIRAATLREAHAALMRLPVVGIATVPYLAGLTACRSVVGGLIEALSASPSPARRGPTPWAKPSRLCYQHGGVAVGAACDVCDANAPAPSGTEGGEAATCKQCDFAYCVQPCATCPDPSAFRQKPAPVSPASLPAGHEPDDNETVERRLRALTEAAHAKRARAAAPQVDALDLLREARDALAASLLTYHVVCDERCADRVLVAKINAALGATPGKGGGT